MGDDVDEMLEGIEKMMREAIMFQRYQTYMLNHYPGINDEVKRAIGYEQGA